MGGAGSGVQEGAALTATRGQWGWVDSRTGRRASVTSVPTRAMAERVLAGWIERDRRGGRPDLHDVIPHLVVALVGGPVTPPNG
jgi:hypothetical protein